MTSLLDFSVSNATTLIENLIRGAIQTSKDALHLLASLSSEESSPSDIYEKLSDVFYFDEFQSILLKTFLLMQLCTLVLIFVSWKVYGKRISERFMKPATSRAIQELKDSVSRLKLPKEHTPRI